MITFKDFLSEEEIRDIKWLLKKDCSPFLKEAAGAGFLVRGIRVRNSPETHYIATSEGDTLPYLIKDVRQDRKPMSTKEHIHLVIDEWFKRNMGFRARSSTMFVFGNNIRESTVKDYGTVHLVFPVGPIKYVWSPHVRDLYVSMPMKFDKIEDPQALEETVSAWLDKCGYKTKDLDEAILQSKCEIMMQCSKYYAFPVKYKEQIEKELQR